MDLPSFLVSMKGSQTTAMDWNLQAQQRFAEDLLQPIAVCWDQIQLACLIGLFSSVCFLGLVTAGLTFSGTLPTKVKMAFFRNFRLGVMGIGGPQTNE